MNIKWQDLFIQYRKVMIFGLYGAIGSVVAAILIEILLVGLVSRKQNAPQVDILFVLDVTGSMEGEIRGVQGGIKDFASEFVSQNFDPQIGLIAFRDRFEGEEPIILSFGGKPFTSDHAAFSSQVGRLSADGGGDDPESSFDALYLAAQQPFRSDAYKIVVFITDAPPKVPDKHIASLAECARILKNRGINQLHLVISKEFTGDFNGLQAEVPGQVFLLSDTAAGRMGFEKILPKIGGKIVQDLLGSGGSSLSLSGVTLKNALWTAFIAVGIAGALLISQNHYLRRRLLTQEEGLKVGIGSFLAGFGTGAITQLLFASIATTSLAEIIGRILGWVLLGALVGGGMSFFIPNLPLPRAVFGGAVGGLLGVFGFFLAIGLLGYVIGRLLGATLIGFCLGLMIALIEETVRNAAYLIVHYNPNPKEAIKILLGSTPIIIGSSQAAHIHSRALPDVAAKMYIDAGNVVIDVPATNQKTVLQDGKHVTIGGIIIDVHTR